MVSRLFQIVYMLMENPNMTAKMLAEKLEVSQRTIYRDIDKLSAAGIPVYTNQGKGGGIALLPDYILDKKTLSVAERNRILEALQALEAVGFNEDEKALEQLQSFFGTEIQDWIEIDFSGWSDGHREEELFYQLKNGIIQRNYVRIQYAAAEKEPSLRLVRPLKLLFREQAWYLYAFCEERKDYRYFKLRRIMDICILEEHFEPEQVGKLCKDVYSDSMRQKEKQTVWILIDKRMAYRAYDEMVDITLQEDGTLLCKLDIWDEEEFLSYLFSYQSYAQVVFPEKIREMAAERLAGMISVYENKI